MFVKLYAIWCGHCKTIDESWNKLINIIKTPSNGISDKNFAIVSVEEKKIGDDINKIIADTQNIEKIEGFPTIGSITYDKNNKAVFTDYIGERNEKGMLEFVKKHIVNSTHHDNKKHNMKGGGLKRRRTKRKTKHTKRRITKRKNRKTRKSTYRKRK